ncbi:MAG TPA: hypothetical protein VN851_17745 [Thermoanaerobaculia bacterium]|nr:hypothetical protein [Thermoanaerobaculia bacterium]
MSLIDEALKRARHEASRQEAVKRDAARHDGPRPIPRLYAEQSASRAPLWAGIATGAAVALLGVVAWLLWGRAPSAAPVAPQVAVAQVPAASAAASPPSAPQDSAPKPVARPEPAPAAPPAPPTAAAAPMTPPLVREQPPQPTAPSAAAPEPAAATRRRDQSADPSAHSKPEETSAPRSGSTATAGSGSSAAPQTYIREVALPGGGPHFRLGGIAYSEEAPIALINGAALGKGEVVEGYVVRRIDAAEVELEGPGGRVVLRLK